MPPAPYYTPNEAAEEIGVTPRSVYTWLYSGELKATQRGQFWRISPRNLVAFKRRRMRQRHGRKPAWLRAAQAAKAPAWVNRGVARGKLGDWAAAVQDLEEALRLQPNASWANEARKALATARAKLAEQRTD